MHSLITTLLSYLAKYSAANSTSPSFTALAKSSTLPAGAKSLTTGTPSTTASTIDVVPVGVGTAGQTFSVRVIGWNTDDESNYVPSLLATIACTLSAVEYTTSGNKSCDTLTIAVGSDGVDVVILPRAAGFASFRVDTNGSQWFTLDYDMTGATSGNCYWKVR